MESLGPRHGAESHVLPIVPGAGRAVFELGPAVGVRVGFDPVGAECDSGRGVERDVLGLDEGGRLVNGYVGCEADLFGW